MRLAFRNSLTALLCYLAILGGVGFWMERELRTIWQSAVEETAQFVGREIAAALSESTLEQLLKADPAASERLKQLAADVTQRSQVVTSLLVVDTNGSVVAGDEDLEIGRQAPIPELVFGNEKQPQPRLFKGGLPRGEFYLFVPLLRQETLVGYLRLSLKSQRIAKLYREVQQHFLLAAALGLGFIGTLGLLFHIQLSRVAGGLSRALEAALRGEAAVRLRQGGDEFDRAIESARKIGSELQEAREQRSQTHRRLSALMKVMDVGVLVLGSNLELDFANARARELLGCNGPAELERRWDGLRRMLAESLRSQETDARIDLELPVNGRSGRLRFEVYQLNEDEWEGHLVVVKSRESIDALEEELRLAIQMRGFARFYMAFAHDLRAPLNAMVMNLELLADTLRATSNGDAGIRERQERYIAVLKEEIARLDRYLHTLLDQATPVADELAQLALAAIRDEAPAEQAVAEEIGDPLGVTDVGLAPRHGLQVRGVDDEQLEAGLEDVVDRLPERPGALHRDVADIGRGQPVGEREQLASGRSERSYLAGELRSRTRGQPTGDDRALVDIEPGAAGMDDLHGDASTPDGREGAHPIRGCLACSSRVRATDGDTCERPGRSQDRAQRTNSSRPVVCRRVRPHFHPW